MLGKKLDTKVKVNKYVKLLMNDEETANSTNNGNNNLKGKFASDIMKCNTTKNKFMKEIFLFS